MLFKGLACLLCAALCASFVCYLCAVCVLLFAVALRGMFFAVCGIFVRYFLCVVLSIRSGHGSLGRTTNESAHKVLCVHFVRTSSQITKFF